MFVQYKLDFDNNINIDFANLFKKVIEFLMVKKKLASLVYIKKRIRK